MASNLASVIKYLGHSHIAIKSIVTGEKGAHEAHFNAILINKAEDYITLRNGKRQLWINLQKLKPEVGRYIAFSDIESYINVYIDLDCEKPEGMKDYAATESERSKAISQLPILQTWLESHGLRRGLALHTGNGAGMVLPIPETKAEPVFIAKLATFLKLVQADIPCTDPAMFDPPRVTGIPGTINAKLETDDRKNQVREIVGDIPGRVEDQALLSYIQSLTPDAAALKEWSKKYNEPQAPPEADNGTVDAEDIIDRLTGLYEYEPELKTLLDGNIERFKGDRSKAEYGVCGRLVKFGFTDTEIDFIMCKVSKIGKWQEEGPHYRFEQTLRKLREEEASHKEEQHQEEEISEEDLKAQPKAFNPRLEVRLEPGNFITKYMAYAVTTSDAYEEYHYASGLVLVSVAADRQIVISMRHGDIYPNIWIFPIGDSTISRKTTAHKLCKLILNSKYPRKSLPSSFSPEALMDAISATPRSFYLKDEAGSLLSSLCKDYMAETRDFLAEIYECENYYRKLKKSECQITNPYITQYLMTTPDNLKEYTTQLDLTSGWLLRYLWMYPNYPKEWKPFAEKNEGDSAKYATIYGEYNLMVEKLATARRLIMTPEAMQFFQEWQKDIEETAMQNADNITKALSGRLMTHAVKMAALFTIGREDFDENARIELPHIREAARQVVEYFLPIGKIIIEEVARSESKNVQDKIIGTLKRFNGLIKQRDLLRALHMKVKEVDESIEALVLSEEIERHVVKSKKGDVLYYKLRECHSDIVSHDEVYKGNNEGSLYTPPCDAKTHRQMGHHPSSDVGGSTKDSPLTMGPNPRKDAPTPARTRSYSDMITLVPFEYDSPTEESICKAFRGFLVRGIAPRLEMMIQETGLDADLVKMYLNDAPWIRKDDSSPSGIVVYLPLEAEA
jgi:hypothetical protein